MGFVRRFLAPAEDPRASFPDAVELRVELLDDLRTALQRVRTSEEQLEERTGALQKRAAELDTRARQALSAGDRDGARDAVLLHEVAIAELDVLTRQLEVLGAEAQRLSRAEHRVATMIDTHVARERLMSVRQDTAEARVRISEALAGLSGDLGDPDVLNDEGRFTELEARAAAIDELVAARILDVTGEAELRAPGGASLAEAVDRRLAALEAER
jgi:phage shock protein A